MGRDTLKKDAKLPPSRWVAHDVDSPNSTQLFNRTLRNSLLDSRASFIWMYIFDLKKRREVFEEHGSELDNMPVSESLVDEYGDLIPDNIKFVCVRLEPHWSTEV